MSGVSLAAAPPPESTKTTATQAAGGGGGIMGSLRVIELQLSAFIMVFSAIGLVPIFDLLFPAVTTAYLLLLSRLAFPGAVALNQALDGGRLWRGYLIMGTPIGLFLPLAYVLGGFARGESAAVRSATPQLFLLSCQILTENVVSGLSLFSPPVRALVPLFYTVRRLFVIMDWIQDVWLHKSVPENAQIQDIAWYWFGMSLAMANMAYFSFAFFGILIPGLLPRAFERYFKERNETQAKMTEDKHSSSMSRTQSIDNKKSD